MKTKRKTKKPEYTVGKRKLAVELPKLLWAVMKAHGWHRIQVNGLPLRCPSEGPHKFIPVFETREQAVAWAGSDEHVAMLEILPKS